MANTTVIYTKLSEQRGQKRLWLEGQRLARMGIAPGQKYALSEMDGDSKGVTLTFTDEGPRKVSRRKRGEREYPVIDVANDDIARILGDSERVRVVVREGRIDVTLHHHEAATRQRLRTLGARMEQGLPIRIGSLAHGGGVLDHAIHEGLEDAGVPAHLTFANEYDGGYLDASLSNNPIWSADSIAIEGPMQDIEWRKLPAIDLLVAGLPCTGASKSGRSKNHLSAAEEHETAGALFVAFLAAIQTLTPSMIVLENVPEYGKTVSMTVIRSVLASLDYALHETVIDGWEMGSLEKRKRFCLVATNEDLPFDFAGLRPIRQREAQVADILDPIALDDPMWKSYDYLAAKEVKDKAAGKGFRTQVQDGSQDGYGTLGRGYAKVRSTELRIQHPTDPALSRILTPAEHARGKTIPESLVAGLSATRAHEILGQSVVHTAFAAVGRHLGQALRSMARQPERPVLAQAA
ncbi:C-5 cytosine-specific DNA methylase (plasmid) [Thioalkalivibrio sp. K90mix]|uniref:DNA cytosine methyltransferase n=1 Tax=Thioalkalivibrio sp. (strain K90mix) TaxID=396595 RepID=UPI000195A569|nr:DNA cytosine methyltransferase [Thioalkalivibrio sp. K90mix]ADC73231.1 C-5 cytosine-specific DNA methylase [Thioalkalivibrio sp. K90mix]